MVKTDKDELLIGLIGDTHIPSQGSEIPEHIINDFKEKEIDYLIHLGDFTELKVFTNLQEIFGADKVIATIGNMDNRHLRGILPENIDLELYGHKILITHGTGGPNDIIERLSKTYELYNYNIIIFGHVHRPFNEKWKDGKLYLCPGTPTDKVFTKVNSYGYLRISKDKIEPEIIVL
ncbi:MAG: metallophosphoesterase family protein [Promethearchaeota archaeon]|jgi:putative phosphoesterase